MNQELKQFYANCRSHPDKAHWTEEQILEYYLERLSKTRPDKVQKLGLDSEGKTIWQIQPDFRN